ncbi:MAG: pilus assembly protein TadG-related protein [Dehalococcoidia bacterium]|nr:pilus assembly protein TadG-related protein [Dehalococcoidia bacterium]
MRTTTKGPEPQRETGQTLIMFALALIALIGFMAMVTDVGLAMQERRNAQNAADAAALAGVRFLPGDTAAANAAARDWAAKNGIAPSEVVAVDFENSNTLIRVRLEREVPAVFARVLGFLSFDVGASAAARTGSAVGMSGLVPFAVLDDLLEGTQCSYPFSSCQEVALKYDSTNSPPESNFGLIAIDCTGASCVLDTIKGGSQSPVCSTQQQTPLPPGCPAEKDTEPGNKKGPVEDGAVWRLDPNNNVNCNSLAQVVDASSNVLAACNPWGSVAYSSLDSDGDGGSCDNLSNGNGSCRLMAIPVIDDLGQGSAAETITEFALFWLNSIQQPCQGSHCEISGYFIDAHVSISGLVGNYDPEDNPFLIFKLVE